MLNLKNFNLDYWKELGFIFRSQHDITQFLSSLEFLQGCDSVEGKKVLDIGAGPGHQTRLFNLLGARAFAVDFVQPEYADVKWIHASEPVCETKKADIIWSHHCLEHIQDPISELRRWNSFLKYNGELLLTVPETTQIASSGHINAYTFPVLLHQLALAGFSTAEAKITKIRSHMRIQAKKVLEFNNSAINTLKTLAEYSLFPTEVSEEILRTGRFSTSNIVMRWPGYTVKQCTRDKQQQIQNMLDTQWEEVGI